MKGRDEETERPGGEADKGRGIRPTQTDRGEEEKARSSKYLKSHGGPRKTEREN